MPVVQLLSERGICLRLLPDPLPNTWCVPFPSQNVGTLKTQPEWELHEYTRVDNQTYVEKAPMWRSR